MTNSKGWLYRWPEESHRLLKMLTDVVVTYLVGQIRAGAQMLQVFESNAEYLGPKLFAEFALPYLKEIRQKVIETATKEGLQPVPMVLFAKGTCSVLDAVSKSGYEVLSLDWCVDPREARKRVPKGVSLQGNLDPCALKAGKKEIEAMVEDMVMGFGTQRYIANLGHGIYPDMDPESVGVFVDAVHCVSKKINSENKSG